MQGEDFVRIKGVLPTRELAILCFHRVKWCGALGSPGYHLPITPETSSSISPAALVNPPDESHQPLTTLRGASVEIDPRRAARVAVALCLTALAVLAVSLFVAGAEKNAEITGLRQQGTPVEVTVTKCFGLLGGSGSNGVGNRCVGTFVLDGRSYRATVPGKALWAPGTTLRLVTIRSDPGLVATAHQVQNEHASWRVFVVPTVVLGVLAALVIAIIVRRRRSPTRARARGSSAQSGLRSGRGFTDGNRFRADEGGV